MLETIIIFVFAILLLVMCVLKDLKIDSLETKLMIKETENKSLKRVLLKNLTLWVIQISVKTVFVRLISMMTMSL